jgi:predicted nuclease of restriction endonuclease-like (RecB) superfamily
VKAVFSVNRELIQLYWQIGNEILARQDAEGWGAKVIDRLSRDLMREFPDMKGFSVRNLKYMRKFAEIWNDPSIVQELLAQITWYHHIALIDKVKDQAEREWYIRQTITNGWSRNVLAFQIGSGLYQRTGNAVTNFTSTLPAPQSDLARDTVKDPYIFDFGEVRQNLDEEKRCAASLRHSLHQRRGLRAKTPPVTHRTNPRFLNRTRNRFCIHRQRVSSGGRRSGLLSGPVILSYAASLLYRHRAEGRTVFTGICRQTQLLSFSR